jgi:hypothetical protein
MMIQAKTQQQGFGMYSEHEVRHLRPGGSGGGGSSGGHHLPGAGHQTRSLRSRLGSASGRRSPRRYRRGYYGYGSQASSQWAAGIQACLAQLVGPWVPQNGIIGPQTRRAVQMFQGQQQLPVTGLLDNSTVNALQAACGGQAQEPSAVPAGPPPASDAPPPPSAPPPDGGAAPSASGAAPPEAGEAEIGSEQEAEGEQQEFRVDGPCQVQIDWHDPVPLAKDEHFRWAPDSPAVYIVYVGGKPWHVSIAEHNLRGHLRARRKALKDLNIPLTTLADRSVAWASLRAGAVPRCAIQHRHSQDDPAAGFKPVHAKHVLLKILKRYFVKKFQTEKKGNPGTATVQFGPNGSLIVFDKGNQAGKVSSGSRI